MDQFKSVEVLLVEDTASDAELTLRALKKRKLDANILWVKDGAEALEYLFCAGQYKGRECGHAKLVLLDLKMPKISGLEVLKQMRANEMTKAIPVVVMTSSAEEPDLKKAYALGANSYIVKPVGYESYTNAVIEVGLYWIVTNTPPTQK